MSKKLLLFCELLTPVVQQQKVVVPNKYGEKLVGILHETGSVEIIILCHGLKSTKVSVSDVLIAIFLYLLFQLENFFSRTYYQVYYFSKKCNLCKVC